VTATPAARPLPARGRRRRRRTEALVLYLTTTGRRTGRAREIEIWFTRLSGRAYLVAETGERAQWVRNLRADPRVRSRIGSSRQAGRAQVVDTARAPGLVAAARARFDAKYGWSDGLLVELRPRRPRAARG
jgi:deazaflavin-dependent oxidoreductase (nitroreductase family)